MDACRVGTKGGTRETPTRMFREDHVFRGKDFRVCSTESIPLGRFPANVISACELGGVLPQARSAGMYPSESQGTGLGVTFFGLKHQGRLYADHGSAFQTGDLVIVSLLRKPLIGGGDSTESALWMSQP